jgi:hypothetical protein
LQEAHPILQISVLKGTLHDADQFIIQEDVRDPTHISANGINESKVLLFNCNGYWTLAQLVNAVEVFSLKRVTFLDDTQETSLIHF